MPIVALKCPNCKGDIELDSTREFGFCQYCGTKIMINNDSHTTINNYAGATIINNYGQAPETTPQNQTEIKDGFGTLTLKDCTYTGEIVNGKANGKGKMVYVNGWTYEGDFVDNDFHGKGVFKVGNITQEGEFVHDKFVKGRQIQPDGTIIEGTFIDGMPSKDCKFIDKNNEVYENFLDETSSNYVIYNNVKAKVDSDGFFRGSREDGYSVEGHMVNGQLHGKVVETNSDGEVFEKIYENDKLVKMRCIRKKGLFGKLKDCNEVYRVK